MTVPTIRDAVREDVRRALTEAAKGRARPGAGPERAEAVGGGRPANPEQGDSATTPALPLARPRRMPPPAIAAAIAASLNARASRGVTSAVASASVAGPGFVNLTVRDEP